MFPSYNEQNVNFYCLLKKKINLIIQGFNAANIFVFYAFKKKEIELIVNKFRIQNLNVVLNLK